MRGDRSRLPSPARLGATESETPEPDTDHIELASPAVSEKELPAVLTVDELASLLRLNRKTTYEALARGEIPGARRIGRSYRISRDAVLQWFAGQGRVSRKRSHP